MPWQGERLNYQTEKPLGQNVFFLTRGSKWLCKIGRLAVLCRGAPQGSANAAGVARWSGRAGQEAGWRMAGGVARGSGWMSPCRYTTAERVGGEADRPWRRRAK